MHFTSYLWQWSGYQVPDKQEPRGSNKLKLDTLEIYDQAYLNQVNLIK